MRPTISLPTTTANPEAIDAFVDAYESARAQVSTVDFREYLPERTAPLFLDVLTELVRVDMEYHWEEASGKRLDDYREAAPEVFSDKTRLESAAFEEYRLRHQSGESVRRDEYSLKYGIDTTVWPDYAASESSSTAGSNENSCLDIAERELDRLADVALDFPGEGDSFLTFDLLREIGRGSFARVYLARQNELADRLVVLKVSTDTSLEPEHLARLQHTNIVPIHSVHQSGDLRGVCMPFFGEATLADVLRLVASRPDLPATGRELLSTVARHGDETLRTTPSPPAETESSKPASGEKALLPDDKLHLGTLNYIEACVWIGEQIAAGLAHAHACGIVHRDLKPANILMTDTGRPMLLDFNLSQDLVVGGRTALVVGGTLPYMSPELLRAVLSGSQVDLRSDVYSVGVLLFELFTGQRPFPIHRGDFDGIVTTMIADREAGAPSVRQLNPAVSRSVESIVKRCLATDVDQRYPSATELREDLDRELQNLPLRHAPDRALIDRAKKWTRRHPRWVSGGAVATAASVLLAIAAGLLLVRGRQVAHWEASETLAQFQDQLVAARLSLTMPDAETSLLLDGSEVVRDALSQYDVLGSLDWRTDAKVQNLSSDQQTELNDDVLQLLYLLANSEARLATAVSEEDVGRKHLRESLALNERAIGLCGLDQPPRALLAQRAELLTQAGEAIPAELLDEATLSSGELDSYLAALQLLEDREFEAAIGPLTALRARRPLDPVLWFVLGNAHVGLKNPYEAAGCYTTCIVLRPESYVAHLYRGLVRFELQEYDAALEDFQRAVQLRPDQPACLLNQALAHKALRNFPQAIRDLTQALELGTSETRVYFIRADLFEKLNDPEAAERDRRTGFRLEPTDEKSWVARGIAKLKSNPEEALADFQQANQRYPGSRSVLMNLVHVLADRLGRHEEALDVLNQLLTADPDDTSALAGRAVLAARMDQRDVALHDLQRLLSQQPPPLIMLQAACSFAQMSTDSPTDARRAVGLVREALKRDARLAERARSDSDLAPVREMPEFQAILAAADVLNGGQPPAK